MKFFLIDDKYSFKEEINQFDRMLSEDEEELLRTPEQLHVIEGTAYQYDLDEKNVVRLITDTNGIHHLSHNCFLTESSADMCALIKHLAHEQYQPLLRYIEEKTQFNSDLVQFASSYTPAECEGDIQFLGFNQTGQIIVSKGTIISKNSCYEFSNQNTSMSALLVNNREIMRLMPNKAIELYDRSKLTLEKINALIEISKREDGNQQVYLKADQRREPNLFYLDHIDAANILGIEYTPDPKRDLRIIKEQIMLKANQGQEYDEFHRYDEKESTIYKVAGRMISEVKLDTTTLRLYYNNGICALVQFGEQVETDGIQHYKMVNVMPIYNITVLEHINNFFTDGEIASQVDFKAEMFKKLGLPPDTYIPYAFSLEDIFDGEIKPITLNYLEKTYTFAMIGEQIGEFINNYDNSPYKIFVYASKNRLHFVHIRQDEIYCHSAKGAYQMLFSSEDGLRKIIENDEGQLKKFNTIENAINHYAELFIQKGFLQKVTANE